MPTNSVRVTTGQLRSFVSPEYDPNAADAELVLQQAIQAQGFNVQAVILGGGTPAYPHNWRVTVDWQNGSRAALQQLFA